MVNTCVAFAFVWLSVVISAPSVPLRI